MIGTILVEGLEVECIVGIHPHEREQPQVVLIDVEMDRDFAAAAANEQVDATVDYVVLADVVTRLLIDRKYQLIETAAEDVASLLLREFGAVRAAVKIMKPAAVPAASWAAVRVERRR